MWLLTFDFQMTLSISWLHLGRFTKRKGNWTLCLVSVSSFSLQMLPICQIQDFCQWWSVGSPPEALRRSRGGEEVIQLLLHMQSTSQNHWSIFDRGAVFGNLWTAQQYQKIETWKKWNSVFCLKDLHCRQVVTFFVVTYRVTNFLPKLHQYAIIFCGKNCISIFEIPYFRVLPDSSVIKPENTNKTMVFMKAQAPASEEGPRVAVTPFCPKVRFSFCPFSTNRFFLFLLRVIWKKITAGTGKGHAKFLTKFQERNICWNQKQKLPGIFSNYFWTQPVPNMYVCQK